LVLAANAFAATDLRQIRALADVLHQTKADFQKPSDPRLLSLRALLAEWLATQLPNREESDEAWSKRVTSALAAAGLIAPEPKGNDETCMTSQQGWVGEVGLSRTPGNADRIVVSLSLSRSESFDTSLYLFDRAGAGWTRRLSIERAMNEHPAAYSPLISRPGTDGSVLLLVVGEQPWCTSRFNTISWELFKLPAKGEGIRLDKAERSFDRSAEVHTEVLADRVTLEFRAWNLLMTDAGDFTHNAIYRWQVAGNSAQLVPPMALQAHEVVLEWLERPWVQVVSFSDVSQLEHDRLPTKDTGELLFSQPCPGGQRWLVGISLKSAGTRYVTLVKRKPIEFRITAISDQRPGGCPGDTQPHDSGEGFLKRATPP